MKDGRAEESRRLYSQIDIQCLWFLVLLLSSLCHGLMVKRDTKETSVFVVERSYS